MSNKPSSALPALLVGLVEDEPVLREELLFQLKHRGFHAMGFADATGLYRHLATQPLAAVVLDIGLPGEDGLSIGKLLRSHNPQLGIVYLTAHSERDDKLAGWAAGADAYLLKPVDVDELDLLLRRLIQRQMAPSPGALATPLPQPVSAGAMEEEAWKLNTPKAVLLAPSGARVRLTLTELQLLGELVAKRGKPCKPADLARAMGLLPDEWDRHRLEVIVSRLRVKVERETGFDAPIRTMRGVGYAWAAERAD